MTFISNEIQQLAAKRAAVIQKAMRQHNEYRTLQGLTSMRSFVNQALREAKMPLVDDDDIRTFSIRFDD